MYLEGISEIEIADGMSKQLHPGDILVAQDTHWTRAHHPENMRRAPNFDKRSIGRRPLAPKSVNCQTILFLGRFTIG
jgi:hypothetical protein